MQVGDLAKQSGASIRSLHYYEQMGVLQARRQPNGYREYDEQAVERVRWIRKLLGLGLSLEDIRLLAPCFERNEAGAPLCSAAVAKYQRKLAEIDEQMHELQELRGRIQHYLETASPQEKEIPPYDY
jgi:DNA-binding transcriptional MerR regulator